jgi:hypothetical protein
MKKHGKTRQVGSLLVIFFLTMPSLYADVIEVANTAGQKMSVEIVSYTASSGNVRIKRADGQFFNTKI